jgi:hypothetical protein
MMITQAGMTGGDSLVIQGTFTGGIPTKGDFREKEMSHLWGRISTLDAQADRWNSAGSQEHTLLLDVTPESEKSQDQECIQADCK